MQVKTAGEVKIIAILPKVDASNAKIVETEITELINGGAKKIVCDFSKNEYISSAGLRVFLATLKMLKKAEGEILLCAMQPYVLEVFDMSGFTQLFKIYANEEEALAAL